VLAVKYFTSTSVWTLYKQLASISLASVYISFGYTENTNINIMQFLIATLACLAGSAMGGHIGHHFNGNGYGHHNGGVVLANNGYGNGGVNVARINSVQTNWPNQLAANVEHVAALPAAPVAAVAPVAVAAVPPVVVNGHHNLNGYVNGHHHQNGYVNGHHNGYVNGLHHNGYVNGHHNGFVKSHHGGFVHAGKVGHY
jgi:hypothetical protein